MNQEIKYYNIEYVCAIISRYIYEKKGVIVNIIPPRNQHEIDLFEKCCNIALSYYGL